MNFYNKKCDVCKKESPNLHKRQGLFYLAAVKRYILLNQRGLVANFLQSRFLKQIFPQIVFIKEGFAYRSKSLTTPFCFSTLKTILSLYSTQSGKSIA